MMITNKKVVSVSAMFILPHLFFSECGQIFEKKIFNVRKKKTDPVDLKSVIKIVQLPLLYLIQEHFSCAEFRCTIPLKTSTDFATLGNIVT